ncbi:MAG: Rpn family recombination-promoting nuclease/putative transposase [Azoarcus sp.]|jgi:predicted transposase/invertase (TIGR01784 family)|nr:Rpn family recombination-promoting nuclease/putative transposase [Azoarcus sp.]
MKALPFSPINDAIFKIIFGDGHDVTHLTNLLKATLVLPAEEYEEVTLVDPHLPREMPDNKMGILDVKVKTRSGKLIDVEIQICFQSRIRERIIFYLSKMINEQIGTGDDYSTIKRSICILITDFVLIPENNCYRNRFTLRDPDTGAQFTDIIEIVTLELPKLPKDDDGTPLWDWLKFLAAHSEEELKVISDKNPQVSKAVAKYMTLTEDERTRMIAESRSILQRDMAIMKEDGIRQGRAEGRREGREEGREEEKRSIARSLLGFGQPVDVIAQVTGLSQETIRSLLH